MRKRVSMIMMRGRVMMRKRVSTIMTSTEKGKMKAVNTNTNTNTITAARIPTSGWTPSV